jgi:hypothetical protein
MIHEMVQNNICMYVILTTTMIIDSLCPPAVLYLGFSIIHILIDLFRGQQNSAFLKIIVMIIFTILLNQLCMGGLTILSWFIVFIPFIMMTYVTTILLYVFGLNPTQGKQQLQAQPDPRKTHKSKSTVLPYNSQDLGGCAATQFGCCPDGVTASNITGSNCKWPRPFYHGGYYYIWSRTKPTPKPSATPKPSSTSKPSSTPTPTPSVTPKPSSTAQPSPSPSGKT